MVYDSEIDSQSSEVAVATVFFTSVDNPPVLDLNGPNQSGRNYSTQYTEESSAVQVSGSIHY